MKNKKKDNKLSRRNFIKGCAACAAMGSIPLFSSLLNLGMINGASAASGIGEEYQALVCILLAGGNDSFNMLVPRGTEEYQQYASSRGDLALPRENLLPLNVMESNGREFGLHYGMSELQQLFDQGVAAFVSNIGTLVEPITNFQEYESGSKSLPLGLFSHADQIEQWQTSIPDKRAGIGVGGRIADLLQQSIGNTSISMNISVSGTNIFQTGNTVSEFSIGPDGPQNIIGYRGSDPFEVILTQSIDSLLNQEYKNIFEQGYANKLKSTLEAQEFFSQALENTPPLTTTFSDTQFSRDLSMVAEIINARDQLGQRRQIFFILFGGWDHHDNTLPLQEQMLPVVSKGLHEFYNALSEMGVTNQVTTFTISDFGRTLTSNGKGSDHGWGGNQIVMGGAVNGSRIFGTYPVLTLGSELDVGRGRFIPTLSTDEFFAELALWFGVGGSELSFILPNIKRFYDPSSGTPPIGFLNI